MGGGEWEWMGGEGVGVGWEEQAVTQSLLCLIPATQGTPFSL